MKAVETFVVKHANAADQAAALIERWHAVSAWIRVNYPDARRVLWSCQERKWTYILFAEIEQ